MPKRKVREAYAESAEEYNIEDTVNYTGFVEGGLESIPKRPRGVAKVAANHGPQAYRSHAEQADSQQPKEAEPAPTDEPREATDLELPSLNPWDHEHELSTSTWAKSHPSELHTDHSTLAACLHHRICNVHHQPKGPPDVRLPNAVTYGRLRSEFVLTEYDLDDDSSDDDRALVELVSEDKAPIDECEPGDFIAPDDYRIL
jgi:hypothetical protein